MRRQRWFKLLRWVLIGCLMAEASYVLAVNAFLNLGGTEKALASTDDVRVAYRYAWSVWPGTVHVKSARMLFHDHNLEWSLDVDWLEIDVNPFALLSKTFRATRVRGDGAVFRMRHRVVPAAATLRSTQALPPIPEFETPAIFPAHVPTAPRTDLWRIHAEDVDVGVVEVWAQQVRYLGYGRARGAFRLHAGYHLWVGPASLDLEPGELRADGRELSGRFSGHIDCVVHPFFVNVPNGREVLRYVSANLRLVGEDFRLEPLDLFLPPGTKLSSPGARLELALGVDHGVVTPSSRVSLHGPELRARHGGWTVDGKAFELAALTASDGLGEARFHIERLDAASSARPDARLKLAMGEVGVASTSVDTTAEWALARVDGAVSGLELPVLSGFDDLVRRYQLRLLAGSARVDASGRYADGTLGGEARVLVSKARGRFRALGWELDGSANASLGRARTEALSTDRFDLALRARTLRLHEKGRALAANNANVDAFLRLASGRGNGRVRTSAESVSIAVGSLRAKGKGKLDIELASADFPGSSYTASAAGEMRSMEMAYGATRGHGARVAFRSEGSMVNGGKIRGWLEASLPAFLVRAGNTQVSTSADLYAESKDLDFVTRKGSASATLLLRDFSTLDAVEGARCQSLAMPRAAFRGRLEFSPKHELGAVVVGEAESIRARWDDFELNGDVRVESRYLQSQVDRVTFDVHAKKLQMKSGSGAPKGWEAKFPELRFVSTLSRGLGELSGSAQLRAKKMEGRLGRTPVHADLAADWHISVLNLAAGEAISSGNIRIDHAGLEAGDLRIQDWWARVRIPTFSVSARENLDLNGDFHATFRDAVPVLGMFAQSDDLPGWVPALFPLHELEATGQLHRRCRTTDILIEKASGGPLAGAGRIQSVPDDTRGAFLVQLQTPLKLSVGLVTYDHHVGVALLAGNDWLSEQSKTLDQWGMASSCQPGPESCQLER